MAATRNGGTPDPAGSSGFVRLLAGTPIVLSLLTSSIVLAPVGEDPRRARPFSCGQSLLGSPVGKSPRILTRLRRVSRRRETPVRVT